MNHELKKYLYVNAKFSGFDDLIIRILIFVYYAHTHGRVVMIDTDHRTGCDSLNNNLANYFEVRKDSKFSHILILKKDEKIISSLNNCTVFPEAAKQNGKINLDFKSLREEFNKTIFDGHVINNGFVFDTEEEYDQQLLVHDCTYFSSEKRYYLTKKYNQSGHIAGGWENCYELLHHLRFKKNIASIITSKIKSLGLNKGGHVALHIRCADMQIDYKSYCKSIYDQVKNKKLVISSDNNDCLEYAKNYFKESQVILTGSKGPHNSRSLHQSKKKAELQNKLKKINVEMFTDLMIMGLAEKVYFPHTIPLQNKTNSITCSDFSKLAKYLSENKSIVHNLLSEQNYSIPKQAIKMITIYGAQAIFIFRKHSSTIKILLFWLLVIIALILTMQIYV